MGQTILWYLLAVAFGVAGTRIYDLKVFEYQLLSKYVNYVPGPYIFSERKVSFLDETNGILKDGRIGKPNENRNQYSSKELLHMRSGYYYIKEDTFPGDIHGMYLKESDLETGAEAKVLFIHRPNEFEIAVRFGTTEQAVTATTTLSNEGVAVLEPFNGKPNCKSVLLFARDDRLKEVNLHQIILGEGCGENENLARYRSIRQQSVPD